MIKIDIGQVRAETPGCSQVLHFNNAGASLQPDTVFQAVVDHLDLERRIGGYEAKAQSQEKVDRFYSAFATLLNCQPEEIAYVENATRAWDMAFYSIPFVRGDRILTGQTEYASNYLAFLQAERRHGLRIDVVPNDSTGQISVDRLEAKIDDRVKLIAITHVPSHGGLVNPAAAIGLIARKYGILYLLDACQSVGQMPIDVQEIGCDMLSGTGRKFLRGPRGTGFLYVRQACIESLEPPFVDLHAATWVDEDKFEIRKDAKRFESWESHVAGRIGLAHAVDYALGIGLPAIWNRVRYLADVLRSRLRDSPGIVVRDMGKEQCGIVTFTKEGEAATAIHKRLGGQGINISVSTVESALLDMKSRGLEEVARASVHYFNTDGEIERFCEALDKG